jgi:hypothetical protein
MIFLLTFNNQVGQFNRADRTDILAQAAVSTKLRINQGNLARPTT